MNADAGANARIEVLQAELADARSLLDAIRSGQVDALLVDGPDGAQVYTLESADRPYRMLIERMQEGAVTLSDSGDVLYCNPYLADMLQLPPSQLVGSEFRLRVSMRDRPALLRLTGGAATGRSGELDLIAADGTVVPVNFSAIELPADPDSPRMVCGVITNLTQIRLRSSQLQAAYEQLQTETQVRKVIELDRERLARLAEASSDFIAIADLHGGVIYLNTAGRSLIGMAVQGRPESALNTYFTAADSARVTKEVIPAVMREGRWRGELQLRHGETGRTIPAFVDMFLLLNPDTRAPANLATITRDLTGQKRLEGDLRQSQKMEAVGQLTGGIAHDFNNLLTGIMGSLELLQERAAEERVTVLGRYIDAAMSLSMRAASMTQRLLAFSRRQPLAPAAVDVNQLTASMEDLLARTLGGQIVLEVVLQNAPWLTLCDANQLESALLNLAINARDAMPEGGRLRLQTINFLADANGAIGRTMMPGQYVRLSVSDTGSGMPPDVLERAFEPFFTTKPLGQGTGLGLSMIYGFASQSEGYARIISEVGVGTTVFLYLPRCKAEHVAPAMPQPVPAERPSRSEGTVLVVEDEPAIRKIVVEILQRMGLKAIAAADGPGALQTVESDVQIDLMVTDVGLPGMNGRQLAERARALRPLLKVLFMTGYAEDPAFGGVGNGMQLITKPFTVSTLSNRVRTMLAA